MEKEEYLNMGYKQLKINDSEEIETLYKKFDNGNVWIVQFNEEFSKDEIGKVYLTKEQIQDLNL